MSTVSDVALAASATGSTGAAAPPPPLALNGRMRVSACTVPRTGANLSNPKAVALMAKPLVGARPGMSSSVLGWGLGGWGWGKEVLAWS
jgi:hypothetical protein